MAMLWNVTMMMKMMMMAKRRRKTTMTRTRKAVVVWHLDNDRLATVTQRCAASSQGTDNREVQTSSKRF